jgi:hypothetical protein
MFNCHGALGKDGKNTLPTKGGQTAILVRWSTAQRTTEMLADQRTGKNSEPAPANYRNGASASPLLNYSREVIFLAGSGII